MYDPSKPLTNGEVKMLFEALKEYKRVFSNYIVAAEVQRADDILLKLTFKMTNFN